MVKIMFNRYSIVHQKVVSVTQLRVRKGMRKVLGVMSEGRPEGRESWCHECICGKSVWQAVWPVQRP